MLLIANLNNAKAEWRKEVPQHLQRFQAAPYDRAPSTILSRAGCIKPQRFLESGVLEALAKARSGDKAALTKALDLAREFDLKKKQRSGSGPLRNS